MLNRIPKSLRVSLTFVVVIAATVLASSFLTGCGQTQAGQQAKNNYKTERQEQQNALSAAQKQVPVEFPTDFDDRRNINEKNIRLNDPEKITYLYLLGMNGNVVIHDTARGPITPCSTQILPEEGPISWSSDIIVVPQPEPNGVFAQNQADCIFYFTPQGAYREWEGQYFMSDQPVTLTNPVQMVVNADAPITKSKHAKTSNDLHK